MIEVGKLYVATAVGSDAKFARLFDYMEQGDRIWRTQPALSKERSFYFAMWLRLTLCKTEAYSRTVWTAALPKEWTRNVHTDRLWLNTTKVKKDPRQVLAWKFTPNHETGHLDIEFCDMHNHGVVMAYTGLVSLIPPTDYNH